jgi:threonine synthase
VLPDELKQLAGMQQRVHKVHGEQGVRELIERVRRESGGGEAQGGIGSI